MLPHLPFTSANLTEIAKWLASNTSVLTVNSGNLLPNPSDPSQAPDPTKPSGSRTIGKAMGTSDNTATIRESNSGVAVNGVLTGLNGVDPTDDPRLPAMCSPSGSTVRRTPAATFDVLVSGGGANPFVSFTVASDVDKQCLKPAGSNFHCVTSSGVTLPQSGTVRLGNYWIETTTTQSMTATCGNQSATDSSVAVPTFRNYQVTSASVGGVGGAIQSPPANDGFVTETTSITFSSIASGGLVLIGLTEQSGSPTYWIGLRQSRWMAARARRAAAPIAVDCARRCGGKAVPDGPRSRRGSPDSGVRSRDRARPRDGDALITLLSGTRGTTVACGWRRYHPLQLQGFVAPTLVRHFLD